ncbi:saccharopine dehydrogenase family protein [Actinomycetospora lemnae]|uniref:Saccharopine dehydrogenase NADP-binding domain-containing protein n=1 Tax=Actinomycetospora lemnae TaxID=3019891 RepID=A0ABT5STJ9_9PSEU|nr:saccharopine dehydrogenase NADP-binding domain-containing protein [Actinomycetospora sp. DW7H6]MDD7966173.1 saccharopine dehydrogenase NADP-binding domain-containing protein [Actinomycetospora sp. DW7H6]
MPGSGGRVIVVGAGGEMCRVAVERLARSSEVGLLELADLRPESLEPLVARLPRGSATTRKLDLFDQAELRELVDGADLVLLGAGPYIKTSSPVIQACLEAKVPYLDFDDDVESTEHALGLDTEAKAAGIPVYVGCGASPGMSNVMAVDAAGDLDSVDDIDLCWLVGDERPNVGRAVLEHLLHISAGECVTWEDGRRVVHETFVETGRFPILAGEPDVLLYETAHPEPVTLPRRYPDAGRIRCVGGLDPAPLNGLARGIGLAVQEGRMTAEEAVDFVHGVIQGRLGSPQGWRHTLRGMIGQVRRGESGVAAMTTFLATSAVKHVYPYKGGLLARVYGLKDGKPAVSTRRTVLDPDGAFDDMGGVTGAACAAFALLALDTGRTRTGAFAPEDWADPAAFYQALERVGVPRREIVETVH